VQAGTVHAGHTTVHTGGHGNYHGNYHGVMGTMPTRSNGTTPAEGIAPATGAMGIMAANITAAATTPTTRPLYRASDPDSLLYSRLQLGDGQAESPRFGQRLTLPSRFVQAC
jgi:hypothetical protein